MCLQRGGTGAGMPRGRTREADSRAVAVPPCAGCGVGYALMTGQSIGRQNRPPSSGSLPSSGGITQTSATTTFRFLRRQSSTRYLGINRLKRFEDGACTPCSTERQCNRDREQAVLAVGVGHACCPWLFTLSYYLPTVTVDSPGAPQMSVCPTTPDRSNPRITCST